MSRRAVAAGQPSPTLKATSSTSSLADAAPRSADTSVYRESSMTTARGPGNSGRPQRDRDGNPPLTEPGRQVELAEATDKPCHPANRDDGVVSGWMWRNFTMMSLGRRDG